jgi:erythromycin esterase
MIRTLAAVWLVFGAARNAGAFQAPTNAASVADWLKQQAIHLKSIDPGPPFDDLKPLKQVFKDVRIVGIGEATHGAHEFLRLKHRLAQFLIQELSFNVIALEASYPACLDINDYVLSGKGDLNRVLAGQGFFTWNVTEVAELLDWLRQYNAARPAAQKVSFAGFDMQNYEHAYAKVEAFLKRVAPDYLADAGATLPASQPGNQLQQKGEDERKRLKADIQALIGFLALHEIEFARSSSREDYRSALHSARIMAQFVDMFTRPPFNPDHPEAGGVARRDFYMAENIEFILNSAPAGSRMIVLAHDSHVSADNLGARMTAMGKYLRNSFGNAYYALGVTFGHGSFQTRNMDPDDKQRQGVVELSVADPEPGSVDWYFSLPGIVSYFVDLRSAKKPAQVEEWLNTPLMMRSIGSGFSMKWPFAQYTEPTTLNKRFDGMVFIETTTRATPNLRSNH